MAFGKTACVFTRLAYPFNSLRNWAAAILLNSVLRMRIVK
jgi:hypothetical protein